MKLNKKMLEFELELAQDLQVADERGQDCVYALSLGLSDEGECCGDCY